MKIPNKKIIKQSKDCQDGPEITEIAKMMLKVQRLSWQNRKGTEIAKTTQLTVELISIGRVKTTY